MSHLSHQSSPVPTALVLLPSFHPAFCILHSPTRLSLALLPTCRFPSPTSSYLLPWSHPSYTHRTTLSSVRTYTCKHTHTQHTQKHTKTHKHTYIHTLAHTPTLTPQRTHTPAPCHIRTAPPPQPAPVLAAVLSPHQPHAPHASSIIRRRRGHGSIAILTPRRQSDNDER